MLLLPDARPPARRARTAMRPALALVICLAAASVSTPAVAASKRVQATDSALAIAAAASGFALVPSAATVARADSIEAWKGRACTAFGCRGRPGDPLQTGLGFGLAVLLAAFLGHRGEQGGA